MSERTAVTLLRLIHATDGSTLRDLLPHLGVSEVQARRAATELRHLGWVEPHAIIPTGRAPAMLLGGNAARVLEFVQRRRENGITTRAKEVEFGLSMPTGTVRHALAMLRCVLAVYGDNVLVLTEEGRARASGLSRDAECTQDLLEAVVSFPGLSLPEAAEELHRAVGLVEDQAESLRARGLLAPERLEPVSTSPLRWPRLSSPSHVVLLAVCRAWESGTPITTADLCDRLAWTRATLGYSLAELRHKNALKPQVLTPTAAGIRAAGAPTRRAS